MNFLRQLPILLLCPCLATPSQATLLDVDAGVGLPYLADAAGNPLPSGTQVQFGTLAGPLPKPLDLASWPIFLADWQVFGSLEVKEVFGQSGRLGGTLSNSASFFTGRPIYLLVKYSPLGQPPQAGLFTSPLWQFPDHQAFPPYNRREISTAQVTEAPLGTITPTALQLAPLVTTRRPQVLSLAPDSRHIAPDSRLPQGLAFRWTVVSDSGLPVSYEITGALASEGTLFRVLASGPIRIRAVQPGNEVYQPAEWLLNIYGQSVEEFLHLRTTSSAAGLTFSFLLQPGFAYQPQYSPDASTWQPLGPILRNTTSLFTQFTYEGLQGFFRVLITWE